MRTLRFLVGVVALIGGAYAASLLAADVRLNGVSGNLGTPTTLTLTNATGLPISTGVSGLGTGVATALATPSSANFASAITDETGSGSVVFGTNPTILQTAVAVASLPTCNAGNDGRLAFINNALTPALGVAPTAGGALTVGVICKNGTGWLVF